MSYYDSIAKGYDELHKEEQLKKLHIILNKLNTEELSIGDVLDVGCGTGFILDIIQEKLGKKCIGIEPSKGMMKQYRGACEIIQASAEHIPFPDKEFSCCISLTAIQNFNDINEGIQEIIRVTKDDGRIIISCLKKSDKLRFVSEALSELVVIDEAIEEEKDIIFFCKKRETYI